MDSIEAKAQIYAANMLGKDKDNVFLNYLRNQLEEAFIAGAKETVQSKAVNYPNTTQQYY